MEELHDDNLLGNFNREEARAKMSTRHLESSRNLDSDEVINKHLLAFDIGDRNRRLTVN